MGEYEAKSTISKMAMRLVEIAGLLRCYSLIMCYECANPSGNGISESVMLEHS